MLTESWKIRPINFPYRVGSIRLAYLSLPFAVLDRHFINLQGDPSDIAPPLERWGEDVLGGLIMSHPVSGPLPRVTVLPGAIRYVPKLQSRYYIDLETTFDTYLDHFTAKTRSTLRRKMRRFSERSGGNVDVREYRAPEEMREFHRAARSVAVNTYQEHLLHNAIPQDEAFVAHLEELAKAGLVRGYILSLDGRPVAYLYCPIWQGAVIYETLGHDPAYHELSPGTVLQYHVLERLFAERAFKIFDFTEGEGQHKSMFATHKIDCVDLFYFRKNTRSVSIISGHYACAELTRNASVMLDRFELRDRARRYMRSMRGASGASSQA